MDVNIPLEIEFLTVREVAEAVHVTPMTLRRWQHIPELCFPAALQLSPGSVRYKLSELLEWTAWLRAQANAKAAGQDHRLVPPPSYVTSGAWQQQASAPVESDAATLQEVES